MGFCIRERRVNPASGKNPSREAILALFNGELARFKHPRDVIFVDVLSGNVMGKVLKFELRDMVVRSNKV